VIGSVIMTVVFFGAFVFVELVIAAEPVLAPSLLRQRVPVLVGMSNMAVSMTNFGVQYYLPMWFETVQRTSVSVAGMHIAPNSFAMSLGSLFAGYMLHKTGKYRLLNITFGILPSVAAFALARLKIDSWAVTQWISIGSLGFWKRCSPSIDVHCAAGINSSLDAGYRHGFHPALPWDWASLGRRCIIGFVPKSTSAGAGETDHWSWCRRAYQQNKTLVSRGRDSSGRNPSPR